MSKREFPATLQPLRVAIQRRVIAINEYAELGALNSDSFRETEAVLWATVLDEADKVMAMIAAPPQGE